MPRSATIPLVLAVLALCRPAAAQQNLALGTAAGAPGSTVVIPLTYGGDGFAVALQLDVTFDATILAAGTVSAGGALADHEVASATPSPGLLRVVIYSLTNAAFAGGTLATVAFAIAEDAATGTTPLDVDVASVVVSNATANALPVGMLNSGEVEVLSPIQLTKTGTLDPGADGVATPGDLIAYTFQVTNTGSESLTGVTLSDPAVSPIACPSGFPIPSLTPEATETCSGSYAITQEDIDAGRKDNTATVSASDPVGRPVSDQASHSVPIPQPAAAIGIAQQASPPVAVGGGTFETTITLTVSNPGNFALLNVQVSDDLSAAFPTPATFILQVAPVATGTLTVNPGFDGDADVELLLAASSSLPVGATETIVFTVRFVPDDLPACFANPASASGETAAGTVVSGASGGASIEVPPELPAYSLDPGEDHLITSSGSYADFGADPIPADFFGTGSNAFTGRVDFKGAQLNPTLYGDADTVVMRKEAANLPTCGGPAAMVDIELLALNLVSIAPITVTFDGSPDELWDVAVELSTSASSLGTMTIRYACAGGGTWDSTLTVVPKYVFTRRGDGMTYVLEGREELNKVFQATGGHWVASLSSGMGAPGTEVPGESFFLGFELVPCACAARCPYKRPADPALHVDTAGAHRADPPRSVIGIAKQASWPVELGGGAFETEITLTVENLGNVALTGVQVTDDLSATFPTPASFTMEGLPVASGTLAANADYNGDDLTELLRTAGSSLAVGSVETITFTVYFVPGTLPAWFENTASASATSSGGTATADFSDHGSDPDPSGNDNADEAGENDPTPIEVRAQLQLVKSGTLDTGDDGVADPGDLIEYTFQVTNTGNLTVSSLIVDDRFVSPVGCPGELAPGASATCGATYVVAYTDVDADHKVNTATATGLDPGGNLITAGATATVALPDPPGLQALQQGFSDAGTTTIELRVAGYSGQSIDIEWQNPPGTPRAAVSAQIPDGGLLELDWPIPRDATQDRDLLKLSSGTRLVGLDSAAWVPGGSLIRTADEGRFPCAGEALVVAGADGQLSRVDRSTSPFTLQPIASGVVEIDGLGFRRADGRLYGVELGAGGNVQLVRIDRDGTAAGLGLPAGLPAAPRLDAGDLSSDGGAMYLTAAGQPLYRVSLPALTVSSVAITGDAGQVSDWAYNPGDGLLYGGDSSDGELAVLDPASGVRADVAVAGLPGGMPFGGAWMDAGGRLALLRQDGTLFEIDLSGPTLADVRFGPASGIVDGAACVQNALGAALKMTSTLIGLPAVVKLDYMFENLSASGDLFNLSALDDLTATFGSHGVDWTFTSISSLPAGLANPDFDGHADTRLVDPARTRSLAASATATVTVTLSLLTRGGEDMDGYFCNAVEVSADLADGTAVGDLSTDGYFADPNGDGSPDERWRSCFDDVPVTLIRFSIE